MDDVMASFADEIMAEAEFLISHAPGPEGVALASKRLKTIAGQMYGRAGVPQAINENRQAKVEANRRSTDVLPAAQKSSAATHFVSQEDLKASGADPNLPVHTDPHSPAGPTAIVETSPAPATAEPHVNPDYDAAHERATVAPGAPTPPAPDKTKG